MVGAIVSKLHLVEMGGLEPPSEMPSHTFIPAIQLPTTTTLNCCRGQLPAGPRLSVRYGSSGCAAQSGCIFRMSDMLNFRRFLYLFERYVANTRLSYMYRRDAPREALQCGLRLRLASRQSPDLGAVATAPLLPLPPNFNAGRVWPRICPNYTEAPYAVPAKLLVAVLHKRLKLSPIETNTARRFTEIQFLRLIVPAHPIWIVANSVWQDVAAHPDLLSTFTFVHNFRLSRTALQDFTLCNTFADYSANGGFVAADSLRDAGTTKFRAGEQIGDILLTPLSLNRPRKLVGQFRRQVLGKRLARPLRYEKLDQAVLQEDHASASLRSASMAYCGTL